MKSIKIGRRVSAVFMVAMLVVVAVMILFSNTAIAQTISYEKGDLLFRYLDKPSWFPLPIENFGHTGIYFEWLAAKGDPSDPHNHVIIEADGSNVVYNYLSDFYNAATYLGSGSKNPTAVKRNGIVGYAKAQYMKPFCWGSGFKGPDCYRCDGLAEAAYESVGLDIVPASEDLWDKTWPTNQGSHMASYPGIGPDVDITSITCPFDPYPTDQYYKGTITITAHADDGTRGSGTRLVQFWYGVPPASWSSNPNIGKDLHAADIEDDYTCDWDTTTVADDQYTLYAKAYDQAGNSKVSSGETITVDNTPPTAPVISSSTHPNEDIWYCNRDPAFTWTTPTDLSGIACYSYTIDHSSTTTPDETCDTTGNSKSYTGLAYSTWYFHVRAKDNAGNWGPADHFRVQIENCDDKDGCYAYGNGCEDRDYYCSGGSCSYTYSNRHTDYYDGWVYYCSGDTVRKHRLFHNYYCSGGSCTEDTSWVDDQLVETCPADYYDDWVNYCSGDTVRKHRLFHNYYCSGGSCTEDTSWVDDQLVETCPADYYDDWVNYCSGDTVRKHRLFHNYYCSGGTCTEDTSWVDDSFEENCNDYDYYEDWIYYCDGDDAWKKRKVHDFSCEGGGCVEETYWEYEFVKDCNEYDGWHCAGADTLQLWDAYCQGSPLVCSYDVLQEESCNDYDGCYTYDSGCEDRDYFCSDGSCTYTYSRHTDYYDDWVYYCKGDEVWKHRLFHDFSCEGGTCTDHTSWKDDQLVEDCNDRDNYYCRGDEVWFEDWSSDCSGSCEVVGDYFIEDCNDHDKYYCRGDEVWFEDWGCVDGSCVVVGDYVIEACDEDYWDCVDSSTVGLYHCTCVDGSLYWDVIDTYDCLEGEECVDGECQEVPEFPAGVTAVFGATFFIFLMMRRKYVER